MKWMCGEEKGYERDTHGLKMEEAEELELCSIIAPHSQGILLLINISSAIIIVRCPCAAQLFLQSPHYVKMQTSGQPADFSRGR
ncbi:unnamed protein product [Gadus morhua 'NCC']